MLVKMDFQTLRKLDEALDDFKALLRAVPHNTPVTSDGYTVNLHNGENEAETDLRLDWELAGNLTGENKFIDLMFVQLREDLLDLIENGNKNSTDPLLCTLDGSNKLSKVPAHIEITAGRLLVNYHWRKDSTECTLYVRLYVKWQ